MKLVIFDLDDTLFDTTGQLRDSHNGLDSITPFPGTIPLLTAIKEKEIPMVLVSSFKSSLGTGDENVQNKKIDLLGIRRFFNSIALGAGGPEKFAAFKNIVEHAGIEDRKQILVVGDRIDSEIMYGNMLGCTTVRLMHGKRKHLIPETPFQEPAHSIYSIGELLKVIEGFKIL